jgi:hypothetical protein
VAFFCFGSAAWGQESGALPMSNEKKVKLKRVRPEKHPVCYLGVSTGICNPAGVIGFDFNIALSKFVTLDMGTGKSTWGNKLFVGSKYYLKPAHRGWAMGGGLTFNSGEENMNIRTSPPGSNAKEKAVVQLSPKTCAYVAGYRYWNLGRKHNRFYVEAGKSVGLNNTHFKEKYGPQLDNRALDRLRALAPGGFLNGIILGTGFSFGLYRR